MIRRISSSRPITGSKVLCGQLIEVFGVPFEGLILPFGIGICYPLITADIHQNLNIFSLVIRPGEEFLRPGPLFLAHHDQHVFRHLHIRL